MATHMLTTVDNPYDPFTQYEEWLSHDNRMGHDSLSILGRVVFTSDELSEEDQNLAIEAAIDYIVTEDPNLIYRKVSQT